ncbi:phosphotransferase [Komagataeibacter sucrofermentans]|uniref:Phosphotransferase n=1 Tax=Komagataeibacter sucrofermentans TaxID=1053551 RepID=A0A318QKW7_9PROT|nr:phosphotransferase [Komagataeibacter sucrofermentans]PYD80136.1 phosphotransferase [Komagataeibacter sucrofermentans]GBQ48416.1 phosphotransferase [Komagataeibacter sucrofermentans DSM 15973]
MLTRADIEARMPHAGASCMLERVIAHDVQTIHCTTRAHLDPANPLRRNGRLDMVCGVEIGMQAAALHGGLHAQGATPRIGYLTTLRQIHLAPGRLDQPQWGTLQVRATCEQTDEQGMRYHFRVESEAGAALVTGHGFVVLQPQGQQA